MNPLVARRIAELRAEADFLERRCADTTDVERAIADAQRYAMDPSTHKAKVVKAPAAVVVEEVAEPLMLPKVEAPKKARKGLFK